MHLSPAEALQKRDQLVAEGYTVVPDVADAALLREMRAWAEDYFARTVVDHKYRYQGSDVHVRQPSRWDELGKEADERMFPDPFADRVLTYPGLTAACAALQLEGLHPSGALTIISKPPHGPPLYWHQDYMDWNNPSAATPWPTKVFLSIYLTDTTVANGCLRVIPGTHRTRVELHDTLPDAHEREIQAVDDHQSHPAFQDHPDAVDLPVRAGDLVIADARVMHAAHANTTDQRRTLVLMWHDVFPFPAPPSWWTGPVPKEVRTADPTAAFERRRTPSAYI